MIQDNPFQSPKAHIEDAGQRHCDISLSGFEGRLGRLRFLSYAFNAGLLAMIGFMIVFGIIAAILIPNGDGTIAMIVLGFLYLAMLAVCLAVPGQYGARRLHDLDRSGWWWLLMLLPIVNLVFLLVLLAVPGKKEPNNYGPPPPPNSAGVWIGALVPVVVVPVIALMIFMAISEANDHRTRAYGRMAQSEFTALINDLHAHAGTMEETRAYLATLDKGEGRKFSALQPQASGDSVHISIKKPEHWKQAGFILKTRQEKEKIVWQCAVQGGSSKTVDSQFDRLRELCQELQ